MNCPTETRILAFLDREAPLDESSRIEAHLQNCAHCRDTAAALTASLSDIGDLLNGLSEMPLRAAAAPAAIPQPYYLKRIAAGAAVAACVLVSALLSRTSPAVPKVDHFVSLDESHQDPIQFGTIVRVSLPATVLDPAGPADPNQQVQAEVLLGDDGRPRAIRFLH